VFDLLDAVLGAAIAEEARSKVVMRENCILMLWIVWE